MTDLKIACLQMAIQSGAMQEDAVRVAAAFEAYILSGSAPPVDLPKWEPKPLPGMALKRRDGTTVEIRKDDRFLPWWMMKDRVPYTRQHLSRLEAEGKFPKRIQLGAGRVAWLESEVDAWIANTTAEDRGAV